MSISHKRDILYSIGLSFNILGVIVGNFIRSIFKIELVNIIMALSLLLIVNYKNIYNLRFPSLNKNMILLLISQVIIIIYYGFNTYSSPIAQSIHLFYSIILIICFSSLNTKNLFKHFFPTFYILSSITVVLAFYIFSNGFQNISFGTAQIEVLKQAEIEGRSMIFLYPTAALYHTIITLILYPKINNLSRFLGTVMLILLIADFILVLSSGKRTVVLIFFTYILYYLWNKDYLSKYKQIPKYILIICLLYILINYLFIQFTFLQEYLESFQRRITNGIETLIGYKNKNTDESAYTRVILRNWAMDIYNTQFTWKNHIIGYGYMTKYLDQPILQCMFDMGLIGIFVYIYNAILFPLYFLCKKEKYNNYILFAKMLCINIIITCFTAGTPYGYQLYFPTLLLIYMLQLKQKLKTKPNFIYKGNQYINLNISSTYKKIIRRQSNNALQKQSH